MAPRQFRHTIQTSIARHDPYNVAAFSQPTIDVIPDGRGAADRESSAPSAVIEIAGFPVRPSVRRE
jgi:hypothetical protein